MTTINAYAAKEAGGKLEPFTYETDDLGPDEVEVDVTSCGICHSDLSMRNNDWGMSAYPFVPGHEVAGKIAKVGANVKHLKEGDVVGVGWTAHSCLVCGQCMKGDHHHCPDVQGTIIGRHGGFADKIRAQAAWTIKLPDDVRPEEAGPLFCGGITVFSPFLEQGIKPTDRVGIVGIGGLGHMAIQFARAWGCEVWAFTTSPDKEEEAKSFGAHKVANTRNEDELKKLAGQFDMILSTVNVPLPWSDYMAALAPRGRFINVGAVVEKPLEIGAFDMIPGAKSVSGNDTGSPTGIATMLEFCARHDIHPKIETFPFDKVNEAMEHLEAGKARYRIVLTR